MSDVPEGTTWTIEHIHYGSGSYLRIWIKDEAKYPAIARRIADMLGELTKGNKEEL
jgi:hypothetical protein